MDQTPFAAEQAYAPRKKITELLGILEVYGSAVKKKKIKRKKKESEAVRQDCARCTPDP